MRLKDKVCVITGAGGGMGLKAAERFAEEGGRIAIFEISEAIGQKAEESIRAQGGDAKFFACDVSNEGSVKVAVAAAVETFGRLDVLYNNAGIMPEADHSVLDTSVEMWDKVMAVNVRSIFLTCKYVIPHMLEKKSGSIINIASFVAMVGCSVPQDAYTASKGAVISLTKSLAIQFRPQGVRSNAICPGPIETPLMTEWLLKDEEAKRIRLNRQPSGRFGRPEDIVNCALYLASDESDWTNGAVMVVDGGITSNYF
ncbi:SDR family NAD(P)-dependent oxidoreductase [Ferroacidibacillus organovorans]|uniref:Short-chain dehydrogenase n=1 Tax=Ferroacidibacillus organovorans TaxID=1765683 RepID=A0A162U017_9BACL|nr:glucose 1-dehydrogenase [Ferroacidibacillus organovorans]KYP81289.1 short-chain dehydrogenase [Ferroacidibacillus organovorans]OAG95314.1 short-chain dehydrogenase [Ferroacidibacillus organovorans]OPG17143.1 short-chain dehydrogenase [Ferroacidibacillus organovorans]